MLWSCWYRNNAINNEENSVAPFWNEINSIGLLVWIYFKMKCHHTFNNTVLCKSESLFSLLQQETNQPANWVRFYTDNEWYGVGRRDEFFSQFNSILIRIKSRVIEIIWIICHWHKRMRENLFTQILDS